MPNLYKTDYAKGFDDVMLVPQYNIIPSRLDVDLRTRLTRNHSIAHPICSTNMSTVTEVMMLQVMHQMGTVGFLHRFMPTERILDITKTALVSGIHPLAISVGVKDEAYEFLTQMWEADLHPDIILVDIAHGDSCFVEAVIKFIKMNDPNIDVIAGNVATAEGALHLVYAGADAVRVGIGGSMVCTTRQVTGHGVPTLQSIQDVKETFVARGIDVPIVGDGGFKTSGDIVKALAFGAETVTLGTLLAATSCAPGKPEERPAGMPVSRNYHKRVHGMSSKEAQDIHKGGLREGIAPEGIEIMLPYKGETSKVIEQLCGGIRSGMTYSGVRTIKDLYDHALVYFLTPGAQRESYVR